MKLSLVHKRSTHTPAGHGGGGRPCTCKTSPAARCLACGFFRRVSRDIDQRRAAARRRSL